MYPLGILFGLGFDTSSEIALLGISSIEAAKGTSFWVILILPALFTGEWTNLGPDSYCFRSLILTIISNSRNVSIGYDRRSTDVFALHSTGS